MYNLRSRKCVVNTHKLLNSDKRLLYQPSDNQTKKIYGESANSGETDVYLRFECANNCNAKP